MKSDNRERGKGGVCGHDARLQLHKTWFINYDLQAMSDHLDDTIKYGACQTENNSSNDLEYYIFQKDTSTYEIYGNHK